MDIDLYQEFTKTTNLAPGPFHAITGLAAEAGEVASCYQKWTRGDFNTEERRKRLVKELGGLMWYISELCNAEDISLTEVLIKNRDQLIDRQNRDMLRGDGDDR